MTEAGEVVWQRECEELTFDAGLLSGEVSVTRGYDGGSVLSGRGFLVKVDERGDTVWTRTRLGSVPSAMIRSGDTHTPGFVLAGATDVERDEFGVQHAGNSWILRTNRDGETLWEKTYDYCRSDSFADLMRAHDGCYVLTGTASNGEQTGTLGVKLGGEAGEPDTARGEIDCDSLRGGGVPPAPRVDVAVSSNDCGSFDVRYVCTTPYVDATTGCASVTLTVDGPVSREFELPAGTGRTWWSLPPGSYEVRTSLTDEDARPAPAVRVTGSPVTIRECPSGDGGFVQTARLLADERDAADQFGSDVAVAGDTALVGTSGTDPTYVFARSDGSWSQQTRLLPDEERLVTFGRSVTLDGDTALVGLPVDDERGTPGRCTRSSGPTVRGGHRRGSPPRGCQGRLVRGGGRPRRGHGSRRRALRRPPRLRRRRGLRV